MKYLCGCIQQEKINYSVFVYGNRMSNQRIEDGLEVCPQHGYPLEGYLSPNVIGSQGNNIIDYSNMGSGKTVKINFDQPDIRIVEDPTKIGQEILSNPAKTIETYIGRNGNPQS